MATTSTSAPRPAGGRPGPGGRPSYGGRPGPGGRRPGGRPRYYARRKLCSFCVDHIKYIDYKDVERLRRFLSDRFRMEGRRKTGVCAKHQRGLASAIKRARMLAMLPLGQNHRIPAQSWSANRRPPAPSAPEAPVAAPPTLSEATKEPTLAEDTTSAEDTTPAKEPTLAEDTTPAEDTTLAKEPTLAEPSDTSEETDSAEDVNKLRVKGNA